jgi:hypothetical protein
MLPHSCAGIPFGVTHPIGLPRPIDQENFFGAKFVFFARNAMPIPTGCLAHFDAAIYRPYVQSLVGCLGRREPGWSGPITIDDPPRYGLFRYGAPAEIPADLWLGLPGAPRVSLEGILLHFDDFWETAIPTQMLDLLSLVQEDLGSAEFSTIIGRHPWVADFMR